MKKWYLYLVQCDDGSIYTGITTDVRRRVNEHNYDNKKGAKYTRSRRPVFLLGFWEYPTKSDAAHAEKRMKKRSRDDKKEFARNPETWTGDRRVKSIDKKPYKSDY